MSYLQQSASQSSRELTGQPPTEPPPLPPTEEEKAAAQQASVDNAAVLAKMHRVMNRFEIAAPSLETNRGNPDHEDRIKFEGAMSNEFFKGMYISTNDPSPGNFALSSESHTITFNPPQKELGDDDLRCQNCLVALHGPVVLCRICLQPVCNDCLEPSREAQARTCKRLECDYFDLSTTQSQITVVPGKMPIIRNPKYITITTADEAMLPDPDEQVLEQLASDPATTKLQDPDAQTAPPRATNKMTRPEGFFSDTPVAYRNNEGDEIVNNAETRRRGIEEVE